ncbi:MAG: hypothetical protein HY817_02355 [Candidatus Abawacabacteria bacterium]|nr:hypothetical protein [Candidatus Abawacabacteria bacterium]
MALNEGDRSVDHVEEKFRKGGREGKILFLLSRSLSPSSPTAAQTAERLSNIFAMALGSDHEVKKLGRPSFDDEMRFEVDSQRGIVTCHISNVKGKSAAVSIAIARMVGPARATPDTVMAMFPTTPTTLQETDVRASTRNNLRKV